MRMKDETPETDDSITSGEHEEQKTCASSRISYGQVKQVDKQLTAREAVQLLSKVEGQPQFTGLTEDQVTVTNYS